MNTLSSILKFIGNTIGDDPTNLKSTSKTIVGSINEEHDRIHDIYISTATPTAGDGNDGDVWFTYTA